MWRDLNSFCQTSGTNQASVTLRVLTNLVKSNIPLYFQNLHFLGGADTRNILRQPDLGEIFLKMQAIHDKSIISNTIIIIITMTSWSIDIKFCVFFQAATRLKNRAHWLPPSESLGSRKMIYAPTKDHIFVPSGLHKMRSWVAFFRVKRSTLQPRTTSWPPFKRPHLRLFPAAEFKLLLL